MNQTGLLIALAIAVVAGLAFGLYPQLDLDLVSPFYDRATGWPFPLSVELLVILAVAYYGYRWRQRRLDIEGPP